MDRWENFKSLFFEYSGLNLSLDLSRMVAGADSLSRFSEPLARAFRSMGELEAGAIANPDEGRMVGHYWLRNPGLAPSPEIRKEIEQTLSAIRRFSAEVHEGKIMSQRGDKFKHLLVIGIGGSALGPQFVSHALHGRDDPLDLYFFDNTDPDGMSRVLSRIPSLSRTLCIVISKSGGTKETKNGMLVAQAAWREAGLDPARAFVAVTGHASELDKTADREGWLKRFPMWDWVGGRTSELSAVGLLPAALQGFNIDELLRGARETDEVTRCKELADNPAALLAAAWYAAGDGQGRRAMVMLPYCDRLELFSRYLQQLVMESLGKEKDLTGKVVNQGLTVYGNKGSTDQHAYIQQLRDGLNNFFVLFVEVLKDRSSMMAGFDAAGLEVEPGITAGDYLSGFFQGTRSALFEKGRPSLTITVQQINEYVIGQLIALFERAVGLYAAMININAYHQPGVEAGKKGASAVLALQVRIISELRLAAAPLSLEELSQRAGAGAEQETIFRILRRLSANGRVSASGGPVLQQRYSLA